MKRQSIINTTKALFATFDVSVKMFHDAMINAMTNGKVNPTNADYKGTDDFLETDYHE